MPTSGAASAFMRPQGKSPLNLDKFIIIGGLLIIGYLVVPFIFSSDISANTITDESQANGLKMLTEDIPIPQESKYSESAQWRNGFSGRISFHTGLGSLDFEDSTGTNEAHPACGELADALFSLFTCFPTSNSINDGNLIVNAGVSPRKYTDDKIYVKKMLKEIHERNLSCDIRKTNAFKQIFTFPMSWSTNDECTAESEHLVSTGRLFEKTKVLVPWLLFRPNLVLLSELANEGKVELDIQVDNKLKNERITTSPKEKCPRIREIFTQTESYLKSFKPGDGSKVLIPNLIRQYKTTLNDVFEADLRHQMKIISERFPDVHLHIQSPLGMKSNLEQRKQEIESKNTGPPAERLTVVFVAGLEGVGHHMFSDIGRKASDDSLYTAFTEYLTMTYTSSSISKVPIASYDDLVRNLTKTISENVHWRNRILFLNTVFTTHPVNMYSYPYGGPRCYMKKYGRNACNIDLVKVSNLFASVPIVDFKVIFLKRNFGSAVVSAAVNRNFGNVYSQSRLLSQAWSYLRQQIQSLNPDHVLELNYEDITVRAPEECLNRLATFLKVDKDISNKYFMQMKISLERSTQRITSPIPDSIANSWRERVADENDMEFILDECRTLYQPVGTVDHTNDFLYC